MRQILKTDNRQRRTENQLGQILIIVLLVVVVALGVGLAISARTITNIRLSTQTEESQRAFSAAEAGIEDALKQNLADLVPLGTQTIPVDPSTGLSASVTVSEQTTYETTLAKDDVAQIDLDMPTATPPAADEVKICWDDTASLVFTFVTENAGVYGVEKFAYNAYNQSRVNNFTAAGDGSADPDCGSTYQSVAAKNFSTELTNPPKLLRIRSVYASTPLKVLGVSGNLPSQIYLVESASTTETGVARKVEVSRSKPALPAIFDYVLFSGGSITKQ